MKSVNYELVRYDADEGKVFDYKDLKPHTFSNENNEEVVEHLYKKTVFIGKDDSIENYVEIDEVK